ncbi:hypothetical protein P875_00117210 [Aspergillus parasiticus SU-1]|uniref:Uncharacterized protein n=1 Tax=Aspergillus parasiticus (strain ATCC 56775 / NRRL 5862 / SRRC 143 / SU-1) TaxID=1403190 RepID=A0A0F0IL76_ASPPU|nr:hypothetical protein P875_00117210 [Aspergillus parasiticus SU-1]
MHLFLIVFLHLSALVSSQGIPMADSKKLDTQEIHERCNPLTVANDPNRWLPESGSDTSYTSSREGTPSTVDTHHHQELQEAQEAQEHIHYAVPDDGIKSSENQPYRECAETAIRQFLWTLVWGGIQPMEVPSSPRKSMYSSSLRLVSSVRRQLTFLSGRGMEKGDCHTCEYERGQGTGEFVITCLCDNTPPRRYVPGAESPRRRNFTQRK